MGQMSWHGGHQYSERTLMPAHLIRQLDSLNGPSGGGHGDGGEERGGGGYYTQFINCYSLDSFGESWLIYICILCRLFHFLALSLLVVLAKFMTVTMMMMMLVRSLRLH